MSILGIIFLIFTTIVMLDCLVRMTIYATTGDKRVRIFVRWWRYHRKESK